LDIKNIKKLLEIRDEVELDLNSQKIIFGNEFINFEIDSHRKIRLLEGLDDIDLTLKEDQKIENFEKNSSIASIFE
jgi:3-isopropylmalate dehydratase small subunit